MFQMKGQDKTPEKLNGVEISNLPEKEFNNDSEDDPGSRENSGEDERNVYKKAIRTKEQTNRDE